MKIGLDIGYSSVKIAFGDGKLPETRRLPVGAGPESKCGMSLTGSTAKGHGHSVTINGVPWVAGVDPGRLSDFVPIMDETYPMSDEYRGLFYAALSEVGVTEIDSLVTGLPVSHYRDEALRNNLIKMMQGRHYVRDDFVVDVKSVLVVPQPAGAFGAFTLDAVSGQAEARFDAGNSVLVVDPGHYSLDWVIYNGGFKMDSSGSTSQAGEVVVKRSAELLSKRHGVRVHPARLQDAVLAGAKPLVIGGQTIDFWQALQEVAGDIVATNLKSLRGSVRSVTDSRGVDLVLLAGGGAALFHGAIKEAFKDSTVASVRDPVMANARGFFAICSQALRKAA